MRALHYVASTLFKGLVVILPLALMIWVLYWLAYSLESGLGTFFRWVFPHRFYFQGMGIGLGLLFLFAVGILMRSPFVQRRFLYVQNMLRRIPWIKTLYGGFLDVVEFASVDKGQKFNRVVSVKMGDSDIRLIGFVTGEDFTSLGLGATAAGHVGVYLPMSYQIGGYFALVPRSTVESLDLSIEDATRMVFTAGMSAARQKAGRRRPRLEDDVPSHERRSPL